MFSYKHIIKITSPSTEGWMPCGEGGAGPGGVSRLVSRGVAGLEGVAGSSTGACNLQQRL